MMIVSTEEYAQDLKTITGLTHPAQKTSWNVVGFTLKPSPGSGASVEDTESGLNPFL
jgi:hypothetical protein